MKKFLAFISIIVFIAGCITSDDGDDKKETNDNGGTGKTESPGKYLPFKKGATWTFSETSTDYWGGEENTSTSTYTLTCNDTTTINNKTYWEMENDEYGETFYLRIEGDNVYSYSGYNYKLAHCAVSKTAKAAKIKRMFADQNGESNEILVLSFNKSAGYTWTIDSGSGEGYSYSETGKFVGLEKVVTPAGTFSNCARFETTYTSTYTYEGETSTWTEKFDIWYAPDVGPVKESDSSIDAGETSYLSVALLTSYDLSGESGNGGDGEEDGLYDISGRIIDSTGAGIAGVLLDATAEIEGEDVYGNDTTDAQGNYTIDRCRNGTWTLTPVSNDYTFSPEEREVTVNGADVTVSSFIGTSDGGTGETESPGKYLPLKEGATWTFSETSTDYWEGEENTYTSTYTLTCNGTTTINNKTYWEMENDEYGDTFYLRIEGDNVYEYSEYYYKRANGSASKTAKAAMIKQMFANQNGESNEILTFPFNKSAGYTWTIDSESGEGYSYSETGKFVGLENVVTSAGIFNNCARFENTFISTYTYEGETSTWTEKYGIWLAPDVGPVKESESSIDSGEISYMSEALLTSYDLSGTSGNGGGGSEDDGFYAISGYVVDSSGAGISGVAIYLDATRDGEDVVGNAITDSQGYYIDDRNSNGPWKVEPYKFGYTFSPEYIEIVVSGADVTVSSFIGTSEGDDGGDGNGGDGGDFSISGVIINYGTSDGVADVTVELRDNYGINLLASMMTETDGVYSFTGLADGKYAVHIVKAGYFLDPYTKFVNIDGDSVTDANFEGWGGDDLFTVSGTVTDASGSGIAGVSVTLEDEGGSKTTVLTTSSGDYMIRDVSSIADYTLSVFHQSYTFSVSTQSFTVENADITANFSASSSSKRSSQ